MRSTLSLRFHSTSSTLAKSSLSLGNKPFRIGVVGGGPSGFYAASRLLALPDSNAIKVDLFELLPVPFGLSRFGVAPDHPEVKNCEHKFEETAQDSRFQFFGNVQIIGNEPIAPSTAAQISLSSLQEHYDAIILTYGASLDRLLEIPGETELKNIFSARDFVNWYNGHPYHSSSLSNLIDLSKMEHVTIVGQGNVAMDVGRILLKSIDDLKKTDIPEYALAELSRSRVKRVDIVGRRGPLQLASTTKELREMMALENVGFEMDESLLVGAEQDLVKSPGMFQARMKKRALGLLRTGSNSKISESTKSWSFQFLQSPTVFLPASSSPADSSPSVGYVEYDTNSLIPPSEIKGVEIDPGRSKAKSTGVKIIKQTDMVLKSVGYRSVGLGGVPFDERKSVVRNVDGRVTSSDGSFVPGMYTSGWVARGPNGVIATTMFDAFMTADIVAGDLISSMTQSRSPLPIEVLAGSKKVVKWSDWERIDTEERRRGKELGKVREKMTDMKSLLEFLN